MRNPRVLWIVSCWLLLSACLAACVADEPAPPATSTATAAASMPGLPSGYETWPACSKQSWLWDRIAESEYDALPSWSSVWWWPSLLAAQNNRLALDHVSDVMPPFRKRRIHTFGSVAAVQLVPIAGSPYGGLLRGDCGLIRVSLAAAPGLNPITPGLALKLFVDGKSSTNVQAMPSLDGQGEDTNVFGHSYSTILAAPTRPALLPLVVLFGAVAKHPLRIGLDRLATLRADGETEVAPVPAELRFVPTAAAQLPSSSDRDVRELLAELPAGTTLFQVFAMPAESGPAVHVADVVLTTGFVASRYGDEALFFKHEEAP